MPLLTTLKERVEDELMNEWMDGWINRWIYTAFSLLPAGVKQLLFINRVSNTL